MCFVRRDGNSATHNLAKRSLLSEDNGVISGFGFSFNSFSVFADRPCM